MFAPSVEEKLALMQQRYGGYWRYPQVLDFCYLVNPYFPPQKLIDEIKASFENLLTQYPSGMKVNSLLAAKNFALHPENIVVGNGAAELIKSLMNGLDGKCGFIRPTFEEYPNRYTEENSVVYVPDNENYSYTANDVMSYFGDKDIETLIVINPDNPSGNYIPKSGLLELIDWADKKGIKIIIDESFTDFSDELNNTLLDTEILEANPHLFVVKSISKSYGVPGIRLGVLASGDTDRIAKMKKDVAIWNINSFGEFYLQIEEKYESQYRQALVKFRKERARFVEALSAINGLRVIPSQANFLMVELTGITAKELTQKLLADYSLLIKDLSSKLKGKEFIRLAVRNTEDNDKLVRAISEILR
jgi:histidinol-phosphate/aromatic aminotransferase/cobyric acid decarboxylase-like protein